MSYLIPSRAARIRAKIASKEAQVAALETILENESGTGVQSYRFASGDGAVSTERRSLHETRNNIRILDAEIEALYRKLQGIGIVNMQLRRRRT
jgi:hypothetical protein